MTEWWDETTSGILGAVLGGGLGTLGGLYGAAVGVLAPRGIGRVPIMTIHVLLLLVGLAGLCAAIVALALGQPFHVYMPLLGVGLVLTLVMGPLLPVVRLRYRQADARRVEAEEIRRGA